MRLEPLTKRDLETIHSMSMSLLEETGIRCFHEETFELLARSGALVDRESKIARIPESLTKDMLSKAPHRFVLAARNRKNDLKLPGDRPYFCTGPAPYIVEGKSVRLATKHDAVRYGRLADALKNIHIYLRCHAMDIPVEVRDVHGFEASVTSTSKHVVGSPHSKGSANVFIEIASTIVGGSEELRKQPIFSAGATANSPLEWSSSSLEVYTSTAGYNIPVWVFSEPITGVSSPVTLAGTLVVNNAEVLSGVVINQLYEEGRPCIYTIATHTMDFKTGEVLSAGPNEGLIAAATAQLARFYNLPSCAWMCNNSKVIDAQAAYETVLSGMTMLLGGNDVVWGMGQMETQKATSLEKALIDNEVVEMILRTAKGIEVSEDTLAFDLIKQTGPGGKFLQAPHTLQHYPKEHPATTVSDRRSRRKWEKLGALDLAAAAKAKVEEILRQHEPEPLPEEARKRIDEIVARVEREKRVQLSRT